jgi:hypothetical protein
MSYLTRCLGKSIVLGIGIMPLWLANIEHRNMGRGRCGIVLIVSSKEYK